MVLMEKTLTLRSEENEGIKQLEGGWRWVIFTKAVDIVVRGSMTCLKIKTDQGVLDGRE